MYPEAKEIQKALDNAQRIVIIQADNPDADSLGSSLALEQILSDLGKDPVLYCSIDMPTYLRYMPGWDRVNKDFPRNFDASIVVDVSTLTLFERLEASQQKQIAGKPCVVLDHHEEVSNPLPFASIAINDHKRASTGELVYHLAKQLKWPLSVATQEFITSSILGDTQGLTNNLATADTYRNIADMIEAGVSRPKLEELRREYAKMPPEIYSYKADLIKRSQFAADGQIVYVSVPQEEINLYSPLYNPAPLIQTDMLQTSGVRIAIVFKAYDDGKITGAIRCNSDSPVAAELAEHFGGGGHAFASGFKIVGDRTLEQIQSECIQKASELLKKGRS